MWVFLRTHFHGKKLYRFLIRFSYLGSAWFLTLVTNNLNQSILKIKQHTIYQINQKMVIFHPKKFCLTMAIDDWTWRIKKQQNPSIFSSKVNFYSFYEQKFDKLCWKSVRKCNVIYTEVPKLSARVP